MKNYDNKVGFGEIARCSKCNSIYPKSDIKCPSCNGYEKNIIKLVQTTESKLSKCDVCKKEISINAFSCPHCGNPSPKRCPKCKSIDIEKISGFSKGVSAWAFGFFASNTILNDYRCKKCGDKFK